jgi:hypothetical protein
MYAVSDPYQVKKIGERSGVVATFSTREPFPQPTPTVPENFDMSWNRFLGNLETGHSSHDRVNGSLFDEEGKVGTV